MIAKVRESLKHAHVISTDFREPFATIVHRDMWINNFMVKLDGSKVIENKFVDFQMYSYNSPVRDLLLFICTSVQLDILKQNLDELLVFYHEEFVKTLEELNCAIADFSYEKLLDEIKHYGGYEIGHILFMLMFVVCGPKSPVYTNNPGMAPEEAIPSETKEKAWWILEEFENRKWMEF